MNNSSQQPAFYLQDVPCLSAMWWWDGSVVLVYESFLAKNYRLLLQEMKMLSMETVNEYSKVVGWK